MIKGMQYYLAKHLNNKKGVKLVICTVKPVLRDHPRLDQNMVS